MLFGGRGPSLDEATFLLDVCVLLKVPRFGRLEFVVDVRRLMGVDLAERGRVGSSNAGAGIGGETSVFMMG